MEQKIIVSSPEETMAMAEQLALELVPGSVVTLEGDLAAGKTTFTKGLAKGLGVKDLISSPTFQIVKEYEGKLKLYHMDVYRLDGSSDVDFLFDYLEADGICVIEWASLVEGILPKERIEVVMRHLGDDKREISITRKMK